MQMRNLNIMCLALVPCVAAALSAADAQELRAARPEEIGLSSAALARIAPALQLYVDSGKLAGVVAVIARHGKIGYLHAAGQMDIAHRVPLRAYDVFRIYSMTKPVTAVAILTLVERGKLHLDDPVSKYIPAFAGVRVYAGGSAGVPRLRAPGRAITIEHLLTHTAGLTYGNFGQTPGDTIYRAANLRNASRTAEQFADSIARLPLLFSPGSAWNYSMASDVLGRVIEVASGEPLDRYLDEEIFVPLGMRETAFHAQPQMDGHIVVSYTRGTDGRLRADDHALADGYLGGGRFLSGGGGLLSTVPDYLAFAQMLLNGGELRGRRVLTPASVALMMRNHLPAELTPIVSPLIGQTGYGQGFGGAVLVDSTLSGMPGSPGTYRWWGYAGTFFWIDPKSDMIGMIWAQFTPGRTYRYEQEFQRLAYAALLRK
jgi:CubicO group peptidase (beta-lactamase class C family)